MNTLLELRRKAGTLVERELGETDELEVAVGIGVLRRLRTESTVVVVDES